MRYKNKNFHSKENNLFPHCFLNNIKCKWCFLSTNLTGSFFSRNWCDFESMKSLFTNKRDHLESTFESCATYLYRKKKYSQCKKKKYTQCKFTLSFTYCFLSQEKSLPTVEWVPHISDLSKKEKKIFSTFPPNNGKYKRFRSYWRNV